MRPTKQELNCILFAKNISSNHIENFCLFLFRRIKKYNVSDQKSFAKLWEDFGLYYWDDMEADTYKLDCIKYWLARLYPFKIDADLILKEVYKKRNEEMAERKR